ncbi:replication protein A 70 kDa DNA-binding subunit E-like [Momordica charantia]|uniref:Replication protein A 70 kDa DNA-binding subunit E-like n=1 Tax=Momordica charantia TaxID=3673 RepID=A0A6J1DNS8_MOMCH|nr:replication protein A 70 kDa DNA-binding subunit E-like [Momordica charantia]
MNMVIDDLRPFQKGWTITVTIVRKFYIQNVTNRKGEPLRIMKFIVLDTKGVCIQVNLFNDLIEKFGDMLEKGKTYAINDGNIKPIDVRYMNVHSKIEISLSQNSKVKEIEGETFFLTKQDFCNFESVLDYQSIDVIGGVVQIKPIIFRKTRDGNYSKKREVLLMDNKLNTIKLTLWDDLAENEGQYLEENGKTQTVILITNVRPNQFEGEVSISSSNISVVAINPLLNETETLKCRMHTLTEDKKLRDLLYPSKKLMEAKEVSMDDVIKGKV